jgi:hypothetical protein
MTEQTNQNLFPTFLTDYGSFLSHIQDLLDDLTPQQKGQRFAEFAQQLTRHTEIGKLFEPPKLRQLSVGLATLILYSEDPT